MVDRPEKISFSLLFFFQKLSKNREGIWLEKLRKKSGLEKAASVVTYQCFQGF